MSWYGGWAPYVPVAKRRANAAAYAAKLAKKEKRTLAPIKINGRAIANTFWGKAWCDNLECYSDYENRLPRGRTYVRNGSVIDLQIKRGEINALVSGSSIYKVAINIQTLAPAIWSRIKKDGTQSIASLIDLLQGRFDKAIMERLTRRDGGLFPQPKEIKLSCSCPDGARMCKHVAAVLYGVGARLDSSPELLFTLRDVDHLELIGQAVDADNLDQSIQGRSDASLAGSDLGEIFGIDLDVGNDAKAEREPKAKKARSKGAMKSDAEPKNGKKPASRSKAEGPAAAAVHPVVAAQASAFKKARAAKSTRKVDVRELIDKAKARGARKKQPT